MAKRKTKRPRTTTAFISPRPAGRRPTVGDLIQDDMMKRVGRKGIDLSRWSKVGRLLTDPMVLNIAGALAGHIGGGASGSVNPGKDNIPFLERESAKKRFTGDGYQVGKVFTTNFETGIPTSKSIQTLAKLNGTTKLNVFNTQSTSFYREGADRSGLNSACGFNQKRVSIYSDIGFRSQDFYNIYNLSRWSNPERNNQRAYGLARYLENKVRVMNTGQYFRSKVKIHLFSPTHTRAPASTAITAIFPTVTEFDTDTQGDSIPLLKAFSPLQVRGQHFSGLCDPNTTITSAPDFARQYTLERTFTKSLAPGDVWDFTMKTNLGSGIRLDVARDSQFSNPQALENYLIVFEQMGSLCEGTLQSDDDTSYIGLSPSYLQFEFSKSIDLVVSSLNSETATNFNNTEGGFISANYAVKTFTVAPSSQFIKKVNYDESNVGPKGTVAELYIPVMSDKQVDYAGEKSKQL